MHRALVLSVLVAVAAAGSPASCQSGSNARRTAREVLKSSTNRDSLEGAAISLARSGDAQDLAQLGQLLRDRAFLARLDDLRNLKTAHLSRVIAALGERPTPQVVDLCLTLAEDSVFVAEGDRKSFVLELLAKVRPMGERTAAVFQRSNAEGYFAFNARLLADNGSPHALELFASMMLDKAEPVESRIQCLHVAIVPRRTQAVILRVADQILTRTSERAIAAGVIESVFDFRQEWFGIESGISKPPAWETTSKETRRAALALADRALARRDLRAALRDTVSRARRTLTRSLAA